MKSNREQKDRDAAQLPRQSSAPRAQGQSRNTRRMRVCAGAVGFRSFGARTAGTCRTAAFPFAVAQRRIAFAHAAALSVRRRPVRARLAPRRAATAAIAATGTFV